jgi:UDP-glucuronate decarboxylase
MNAIVDDDFKYIFRELSEKDRDKFDGSKILITGAGGFIGYYMLNFLAKYRSELRIRNIMALDNFVLGKPKWVEHLLKKFDFFQARKFDVASDEIDNIGGLQTFDTVVHMASIASPTYYRRYPLKTLDANVWGLRKMLNFFGKSDIRGFLNFSSSEVYGDPDPAKVPTREDYFGNVAINGPRACYDEAKRFGETLCYVFNREYGINIVSVRPFNNYGPGMRLDDARAPADFANSILNKKDIEIYSDGLSMRTFTYISDALVGYLKALYYGKFDYFNIGMDHPEITISDLAKIFAEKGSEVFGHKTEIKYLTSNDKQYLTNNPRRRSPEITKAKEKLNFFPKIEVKDGVYRFLNYLKEEMVK